MPYVSKSNVAYPHQPQGEHIIHLDHAILGPTCGLLPVGIDSTVLSTTGLKWNLCTNNAVQPSQSFSRFIADAESSFDGLISTSNHLVADEETVGIKTSRPIWWTVELRPIESV